MKGYRNRFIIIIYRESGYGAKWNTSNAGIHKGSWYNSSVPPCITRMRAGRLVTVGYRRRWCIAMTPTVLIVWRTSMKRNGQLTACAGRIARAASRHPRMEVKRDLHACLPNTQYCVVNLNKLVFHHSSMKLKTGKGKVGRKTCQWWGWIVGFMLQNVAFQLHLPTSQDVDGGWACLTRIQQVGGEMDTQSKMDNAHLQLELEPVELIMVLSETTCSSMN